MIRLKKACIIIPALAAIICGHPIEAEEVTQEKIDSMFIIASSGEMKYRELVEPTIDDIAALGLDAVPFLIDKLGTTDARERVTLENIFKKIGQPAVPLLNQALLETDSLQLSRVAKILFYLPDSSSVENMLKITENEYYWVRYQSIRALGKIGDRMATGAVRVALNDGNELVRTIAAVSAGRLADPSLLSDLIGALDDNYYGVRMAALEELTGFDCGEKRGLIYESLQEGPKMVRKSILLILTADSCLHDLKIVKPFLVDDDPVIQSMAIKAAYRIDPDFVVNYISVSDFKTKSLLLRQTINEISTRHEETETSAKP